MNYPIWDVPASGLWIAGIAILHVFISHFAVGGGLFLVLTERKARRESDAELLAFVRGMTRFFVLLTLVLGAVTGVGIWFVIGLVHPQATSSLINTFVWGWAIEWTFFVAEIAAAMVYYYGWERLSPRMHLAIGWVYFTAAWLSLVVINGILSYMLTPGAWVETRGFWAGFFNPTYWPSLVARTVAAVGLAGLYALAVASWSGGPALRAKVARWAWLGWVLPMAVALPVSLGWYVHAASGDGVPVAAILGARSDGWGDLLASLFASTAETGYPAARHGAAGLVWASAAAALIVLAIVAFRCERYGRLVTAVLMGLGLAAIGGGEWFREDLRKPYVIGRYMFVNGVRLPSPAGIEDPYDLSAVREGGVLGAARWARVPASWDVARGASSLGPGPERADLVARAGAEVFRLACAACHTVDGYLAIRPLVAGKSVDALSGMLGRLAEPRLADGEPAAWSDPGIRVATWRERRMPPFPGNDAERHALAVYLARLGGDLDAGVEEDASRAGHPGAAAFEAHCSVCHVAGPEGDFAPRIDGRTTEDLYDMIGRLDEINDSMPPFEGSEQERRALARWLAGE